MLNLSGLFLKNVWCHLDSVWHHPMLFCFDLSLSGRSQRFVCNEETKKSEVFVDQLPPGVTSETLRRHFGRWGAVFDVHIHRDAASRR